MGVPPPPRGEEAGLQLLVSQKSKSIAQQNTPALQATCGFVPLLKCGFPVGDFYLKKVLSHNRGMVTSFYPAVFEIFDILIKNKTQTAVIKL